MSSRIKIYIILIFALLLNMSNVSCDRQAGLFSPSPNYVWTRDDLKQSIDLRVHVDGYYYKQGEIIYAVLVWTGKGYISFKKELVYLRIKYEEESKQVKLDKGIVAVFYSNQIQSSGIIGSKNITFKNLGENKYYIAYNGPVQNIEPGNNESQMKFEVEFKENKEKVDEVKNIISPYSYKYNIQNVFE